MKPRISAKLAMRMPSVKMAAYFAYAAGATGILATLLLIAFLALQASYTRRCKAARSMPFAGDLLKPSGAEVDPALAPSL